MRLGESLELREVDGGRAFACGACGRELAAVGDNYKLGCLLEETPVTDANPHLPDPAAFIDETVVFRRYYCPGCAVQIETEVARAGDPPLHDIEIR